MAGNLDEYKFPVLLASLKIRMKCGAISAGKRPRVHRKSPVTRYPHRDKPLFIRHSPLELLQHLSSTMSEHNAEPGTRVIANDKSALQKPNDFPLNHLLLRISLPYLRKNSELRPKFSVPFNRDLLGMRRVFTFNSGPMTVYYLGYPKHGWDEQDL